MDYQIGGGMITITGISKKPSLIDEMKNAGLCINGQKLVLCKVPAPGPEGMCYWAVVLVGYSLEPPDHALYQGSNCVWFERKAIHEGNTELIDRMLDRTLERIERGTRYAKRWGLVGPLIAIHALGGDLIPNVEVFGP